MTANFFGVPFYHRAVEKANDKVGPLADLCDPATGNTPLMHAAMENKITLMEKMIALGAQPQALNKVKKFRQNASRYLGKHVASCINVCLDAKEWHTFICHCFDCFESTILFLSGLW